jgi:23S rRNA A2030 N6-methylase RlmJ
MANKHFGNVGDVFKHALLSVALGVMQPDQYIETHAGMYSYRADSAPERTHDFRWLLAAAEQERYATDLYVMLLSDAVRQSGMYPGSVALADMILPSASIIEPYDCDLETSLDVKVALDFSQRKWIPTPIGDGLAAVDAQRDTLTPSHLVFIDPFDAHAGDPSSIKVFKKLAKRGIPVILWYPLLAPDDRLELPEKGLRCELRTVGGVPGLHGCGMAFRNLSEEAEAAIYSEALEISRILRAPITVSHDGRTIISDVIINRRSGNVLADRLPPAASNKD